MADSAFWRDLRAQFESLDPLKDKGAQFDGDEWTLDKRGTFYSRFRTFAMRGGAAAIGATGELAIDAWLVLLRDRVPHFSVSTEVVESKTGLVPLSQSISPRSARRLRRIQAHPRPVVEPDRFVDVIGRGLSVRTPGEIAETEAKYAEVAKYEATAHAEAHGWIEHLRKASMELCELLETEQLPESEPTRKKEYKTILAKNLDVHRKECGWTYEVVAEKVGISKDTAVHHVSKGMKPGVKTLRAYADVFSESLGRRVTVEELEGGS